MAQGSPNILSPTPTLSSLSHSPRLVSLSPELTLGFLPSWPFSCTALCSQQSLSIHRGCLDPSVPLSTSISSQSPSEKHLATPPPSTGPVHKAGLALRGPGSDTITPTATSPEPGLCSGRFPQCFAHGCHSTPAKRLPGVLSWGSWGGETIRARL